MGARAVLTDLLMRGVKVVAHGGNLRLSPRHLLNDADRAALRAHKPELLRVLSSSMTPADLPAEWHFLWEERAAIMEFDGAMQRPLAETLALADVLGQMGRARQESFNERSRADILGVAATNMDNHQ